MLITLEGIDGAGKTEQAGRLFDLLVAKGLDVVLTKQPGGTIIGHRVRDMLIEYHGVLVPEAELFLFAADRAQHVQRVIKPALDEGKIVICDRYSDSTLAYQGSGHGLSLADVDVVNRIAQQEIKPDVTIWLDLDPLQAMKRIQQRTTRAEGFDMAELEFMHRVWCGFDAIHEAHPKRVIRMDATLGPEALSLQILAALNLGMSDEAPLYAWKFVKFTGVRSVDDQDLSGFNGRMPSRAAKQLCEKNSCCADAYNADGEFVGSFVDLAGRGIVWVSSKPPDTSSLADSRVDNRSEGTQFA